MFSLFVLLALIDAWSGADYAKHSSVQQSHAERLIASLSLNGDERILDLGCGDGKISALLAEKVPRGHVLGIDPSESMLKEAYTFLNQGNLTFAKGNAESFLSQYPLDHIVSIHVMHWVKDQQTALSNLYRNLKPGGQIHLLFAPSKEGLPYHTALKKTLLSWEHKFQGFVDPKYNFDMETYRKLLVEAGFHIDAIHYIYHESIHPTANFLKAWMFQWSQHRKFLPEEEQHAFMDQLVEEYLRASNQSKEPLIWGEYVLFIEATKPF